MQTVCLNVHVLHSCDIICALCCLSFNRMVRFLYFLKESGIRKRKFILGAFLPVHVKSPLEEIVIVMLALIVIMINLKIPKQHHIFHLFHSGL